jgi:subfamily B ATP-binding cassette protein MsbA
MNSWRDWDVTEYLKINAVRRMFGMLGMRKLEVALIIGLGVLYAGFEGIGLGLLIPVLQYVQGGSTSVSSQGDMITTALLRVSTFLRLPLTLPVLLGMAFLPILLRQVTFFVNSWYASRAQAQAVARLRRKGFDALSHADSSFFAGRDVGEMVGLLTGQSDAAGGAILQFAKLISMIALLVLYAALLLFIQPLLTGIAILSVLLLSLVIRSNLRMSREFGKEMTNALVQMFTSLAERIQLMPLIKMLGQEDVEGENISAVSGRIAKTTVKIGIAQSLTEVTVDPGLMLAAFIVLFVGVDQLHMTLAGLGVFLFVLLRMNAKAKEFSGGRQALSANLESLIYVHRLIDQALSAHTIASGPARFTGIQREIRLTDVGFSYGSDADGARGVLDHIDTTIPARSMTAVVGKSGSGKSTLVGLIPRFHDPTSGAVLLDDTDVREFDLRGLRRGIGYMTQDAMLFNDTLRANLLYGLGRTPSESEMLSALDRSYASLFVSKLPEGLETRVGGLGTRLSGGERQRICLARVFLQDPGILILDEPTSSLDSESERYIQEALEEVKGSKTVIVIAHRLSTVREADQILVLDGGRIAERGTHDELLARGGVYQDLFEQQIHG